jgi:hypothetical protein
MESDTLYESLLVKGNEALKSCFFLYAKIFKICSGFSTVDLVSEASSDRLYALKKIRCHSTEDEQAAEQEIRYHKQINHPSVIECLAFKTVGSADISSNQTSLVLLLLPFYKVRFCKTLITSFSIPYCFFLVWIIANIAGKEIAKERAIT